MTKVFITGMGVISSIGMDIKKNLESLRNGNSGINKPKFFQQSMLLHFSLEK
jgi:3-oxoacyl-(acyl-carrier-protein) synthase